MSTGMDKEVDFVELRDIASDVAKQTSQYILQESREVVPHGIKSSSTDYVTEIDKRAEMLIVDLIKDSRPQDGFWVRREHPKTVAQMFNGLLTLSMERQTLFTATQDSAHQLLRKWRTSRRRSCC